MSDSSVQKGFPRSREFAVCRSVTLSILAPLTDIVKPYIASIQASFDQHAGSMRHMNPRLVHVFSDQSGASHRNVTADLDSNVGSVTKRTDGKFIHWKQWSGMLSLHAR